MNATALLADLRREADEAGHRRISQLLASTESRHADGTPVISAEREGTTERNHVNIDTRIYGYSYEADLLCPTCTIELLIEQGKASPAAREMGEDEVIEQVQEADAADTMERLDSDRYPQRLGAYSGLTEDDNCGGCLEPLYA